MRRFALAVLVVCLTSCGEDPQSPDEPRDAGTTGGPSLSPSDQNIIDLGGLLPYNGSWPHGINNRAQVVGETGSKGFIWEAGVLRDLGALAPGDNVVAWEINDNGQAVGSSNYVAFLWVNGVMTSLGTLTNGQSVAFGINELGTVVGASNSSDGSMHPFIWTAAQGMRDIGPIYPGASEFSAATDINELGEVVLYAQDYTTYRTRSFIWSEAGGLEDPGLPPGAIDVWLYAINDHSEAIGWAQRTFPNLYVAVRWSRQSGWTDPNAALGPGPYSSQALGINNSGTAVGYLYFSGSTGPCFPAQACPVAWLSNGQVVNLGVPAGAPLSGSPGNPDDVNEIGQATGTLAYPGRSGTLWPGQSVNLLPRPSTNGPFAGPEGSTFSFDASSTPAFGEPLTFSWSFGDGTPAMTGVQVSHTFADNRGTLPYAVTLTATSASGLAGYTNTSVAIHNLPPAVTATEMDSIFAGRVYALGGILSDPNAGDKPWNFEYEWGDGLTNSGSVTAVGAISFNHTYLLPGTYQLILRVTDKDGATAGDTMAVRVVPDPEGPVPVHNGPYTAAEGAVVTFDATASTDPQGDPITYSWVFGDGSAPVSGAVVTHKYVDNAINPLVVILTASDGAGHKTTVKTTATITNVEPVVSVSAPSGYVVGVDVPATITFSDAGIADGPWVVTWIWGEASFSKTFSVPTQGNVVWSHAYSAVGPFTITASVKDKNGAVGTATTQVTLLRANHPPIATAGGPYTAAEGQTIMLDASASYDPDGDPITFLWSSDQVGPVVPWVGGASGTYQMHVTVRDSAGASALAYATVTFTNLPPTLQPEPDRTLLVNIPFTLAPVFGDPGNDPPYTMVKDWGDGTSTTSTYPNRGYYSADTHTYTAPGTYTVNISVTDRDGLQATDQFIATVVANLAPVPRINGPYSGKEGVSVAFYSAGSTDPNGDPISYRWSFGDGTAAVTGPNPTHVFRDNGLYTIQLTVTDSKGLAGVATTTANIANVGPTGSFNKPASVNEGASFALSIVTPNDVPPDKAAGFQYAFDCGTGFGPFSGAASRQCPPQPDNGNVTVGGHIRDKDGGIRTFTGTVPVKNVIPKVTLAAAGPTTIARGTSFSLSGSFTDPGALDAPWSWSITWGDGTPATTGTGNPGMVIPASHVFSTAGTRAVKMTVTDRNGGKGTSNTITVTVQ